MFRCIIGFLVLLFTRPLGLRTASANDARASGDAFFNRKARARNGTKLKLTVHNLSIHVVKLFWAEHGFKLSLFGQFLFVSALLWLSLKSKSSLYVQVARRDLPGNVCISSETCTFANQAMLCLDLYTQCYSKKAQHADKTLPFNAIRNKP